jgi:hypothetical protein
VRKGAISIQGTPSKPSRQGLPRAIRAERLRHRALSNLDMGAPCVDTAVVSRNDSCVRRYEVLLALTHPFILQCILARLVPSLISYCSPSPIRHLKKRPPRLQYGSSHMGLRHTARDDSHSTANEIACHVSPSAQDPVTRDKSVHGNGVRRSP